MGIRRRIVVPFLALFALVLIATGAVSTVLVARAVERRRADQTENLARLIGKQEQLATRRDYLEYIRLLYGAESVSVVPRGSDAPRAGNGVFRAPTSHGELVVVYSPDVIAREKEEAVRPFIFLAAGGVLLVLLLGYLTAQAIARPLERLAEQARALPGGEVRPVGGGAELDHLVEAMNRMFREVRRIERLGVMGQVAAGVAHEIRNPLAAMKLTVQMLRAEAKDPEPLDRLLREIERLELTAAELVGTSQPLRKERVRLESVVADVLELMRRQLEHLSVAVERRFDAAPDVEVDVARFKRCIMNLVLNGAQSMPSGGPLTVRVAPRDGRVRFSVTDAGGGVPEGVRDRIFEPFVTTKQDGVGLGLALTKRIVEDHGGTIGFDAAGPGTTFWVDLPAHSR